MLRAPPRVQLFTGPGDPDFRPVNYLKALKRFRDLESLNQL